MPAAARPLTPPAGHAPALAFPSRNNLEWLRLLFAFDVVLMHICDHFGFSFPGRQVLKHFPGVPAFFFVSGFLIYAAYLNAPGWRYFENRFLRLYPGLVFVTLGGAAVVLVAHGSADLLHHFTTYAGWFLAQTTLGQTYNPALFRDVGVGVVNGALWTLTTEILFYLCVPAIARLERRAPWLLGALTLLSFTVYAIGPSIWSQPLYKARTGYDLLALTPVAWGWMFGLGMLALKHYGALQVWIRWLPLAAVPLAALAWCRFQGPFLASTDNRLGIVYFALYAALILWATFGTPPVRLGFDLSYGSYIWHMPVINLLVVLSLPSPSLALTLTFAMAGLSWFFVEKPALRLKRRSLRSIED